MKVYPVSYGQRVYSTPRPTKVHNENKINIENDVEYKITISGNQTVNVNHVYGNDGRVKQ